MKDLDDNEGDDGRLQPKCRAKKQNRQSGESTSLPLQSILFSTG